MKKIKDSDWFYYLTVFLINCILINDNFDIVLSSKPSGLYADNGYQTIIHRTITQNEKREIQEQILDFLDLPDRPLTRNTRSTKIKNSASEFLIDIYKNALGDNDDDADDEKPVVQKYHQYKTDGDFNLTGQDLRAIDQSDVIMSFAAHNHHVPGVRHERGKRLWFDTSEIPPGENIIGAELRLYRSMEIKHKKNRGSFMVTVYRVLKTNDGSKELQYVDSTNTTINQEGWITLNVSEALQHWINNPDGNRGLYLSVHPADRSVHEMKPEDVGIVGFRGSADKHPFMVGFFKSSGLREKKSRQKRDVRRKKKSESSSLEHRYSYGDSITQYDSRTCKLHTLYVNFVDLKWKEWIIAPDGYDAYYCAGECNFPLNAHMNATNHAIVQTLVHLNKPSEVPKPCCAPTKLSATSVLYTLEDGSVILKKYKNMVVKSCGCH